MDLITEIFILERVESIWEKWKKYIVHKLLCYVCFSVLIIYHVDDQ